MEADPPPGGGALMPLFVTTDIPFVPVCPTASCALTNSVCVPSGTTVVSNGKEIGPGLLLVVLAAGRPSSVALTVLDDPEVPSTHTVAQAAPLTVEPGEGWVIQTCRLPPEMTNVRAFEVPPPEGFVTVTVAEPAAATSAAPIAAVSCAALTKVVALAVPFHCTAEPATKFVPLTVSVNAPLPAATLDGDIELSVGVFEGVGAAPPPTCTMLATDGTPLVLRMKSM